MMNIFGWFRKLREYLRYRKRLKELEEMHSLSGSYEALFSKKAQLYKSMDLKNKSEPSGTFWRIYILLQNYRFSLKNI